MTSVYYQQLETIALKKKIMQWVIWPICLNAWLTPAVFKLRDLRTPLSKQV